ncbi:hypothetical protein [Paenochrobactrum pullorum]|uniref:hypothetical protein n=1 Tax=Paenochrobactrum pullorum TaxID=1324351 RepID=UPI0035BC95ED
MENIDRACHIPPPFVIKDAFKSALSHVEAVVQEADNPVWVSVAIRIQNAQHISFLGFGVSGNLRQLFSDKLLPLSRAQVMLTGEKGMERVVLKISGLGSEGLCCKNHIA